MLLSAGIVFGGAMHTTVVRVCLLLYSMGVGGVVGRQALLPWDERHNSY